MEAGKKRLGKKEIFESYTSRINWDWLFLKGQLIFATLVVLGILVFLLWFFQ